MKNNVDLVASALASTQQRELTKEAALPADVVNAELEKFLKSQEMVEVEFEPGFEQMWGHTGAATGGRKIRFWVGRSTGTKPVYLMTLTKRSSGGFPIGPEDHIVSIKGVGNFRR